MRELTDLELDILMILVDNKGHALWEIAKLLGREKSNLFTIMDRLEDDMELSDPLALSYRDIIDIEDLETKFYKSKDPLSQYIQSQFEPNTVKLLTSKFSKPFLIDGAYVSFDMDRILDEKILNELNILLNDAHLFENKRFEHIQLTEEIQNLIHNKPEGKCLRCLNRLLLEDGYPGEIAKCLDPIIYKGAARKTTNPKSKQPKHSEFPYFLTSSVLVLDYIIDNLSNIRTPPINGPDKSEKLDELRIQVKSHQISKEEYYKAIEEIYDAPNSEERNEEIERKRRLLEKLFSSQYALQMVKKYGFKFIIYRIRNIGIWETNCWTLAEKALESGILSDKEDIWFAEDLVQLHRNWVESIRQESASKE